MSLKFSIQYVLKPKIRLESSSSLSSSRKILNQSNMSLRVFSSSRFGSFTPLVISIYMYARVTNVLTMLRLRSQVVLLPVLAGAFLNQYFQSLVKIVCPVMPPLAVATVAILCGNAIAQSSSAILMSGQQAVLAVALLHTSGFLFGYVLSRMLGIDVSSSRTISIEVGMQVKLFVSVKFELATYAILLGWWILCVFFSRTQFLELS